VVLVGGTEIPDFDQFATWLSNPTIIGATLWTGIVTTVLPTFLETRAMKSLSASETTMLYSTEPIFGSLFASFALDESMGLGGGLGAAMVLSGCLYSSLGAAHLEKD
jgi:drug/metabolite transporter (DMT)-like permease